MNESEMIRRLEKLESTVSMLRSIIEGRPGRLALPSGIPEGTFVAPLIKVDGVNGTSTTPATYMYQVNDVNGKKLADKLAPDWPRPNGTRQIGGLGLAYRDSTGNVKLFVATETSGTTTCKKNQS